MARKTTQAERRRLVEDVLLQDHMRSDRATSRACGVSHSFVGSVRAELVAAGRLAARPDRPEADVQASSGRNANLLRQRAGEPGPALKSGAQSETRLAPMRLRFEESLREEFDLDVLSARRCALLADLLSRIELARRWLDDRGSIVKGRHGETYAITDRLEAWSKRADGLLRELHAAQRERDTLSPQQALAAIVAEAKQERENDNLDEGDPQ